MGRRTVWIPDELDARALEELPRINWSAALQAGVRALLDCRHDHLECASCGTSTTAAAVTGPALEGFYRAVMAELAAKVAQPGYEGAARIVRRLAVDHQVPGVGMVPVPRATRANHQARRDLEPVPLPLEADSRHRHPTARPVPANHPGPQPAPPQEKTA